MASESTDKLPEITCKLDDLQLYYGASLEISDRLIVRQPTIQEIIAQSEEKYFQTIYTLTSIPSDYISMLWDCGIDWEEMSDIELFHVVTRSMSVDETRPFFGDLDFSKFRIEYVEEQKQFRLVNDEQQVIIDFYVYGKIQNFLCRTHCIKKNKKVAGSQKTKEMLVEIDRQDREEAKRKNYKSALLPLISSLINHQAFKYTKSEVCNMGVFEFMDSVRRIQHGESVEALTTAYYSGNLDTKKFDTNKLNYMKDLYE